MSRTRVLAPADLNRALLARQMLLERARATPLKAIERLAGMQAQQVRPPFVGLWTRIEGFQRDSLLRSIRRKKVVRATAMRATVHLFSTRDYVALRGAFQPYLTSCIPPKAKAQLGGVALEDVVETGRAFYSEAPRSFKELCGHLEKKYPSAHPRIAAVAVRLNLPKMQVPTDTEWGFPSVPEWSAAEVFLGEPVPMDDDAELLVLKYLAAFGPATPADAQVWSGRTGLRKVFEKLRHRLKVFQDEEGRELFDLPRAPRPSAETPAPVRFIPEFDNLILSHADRTRIVDDAHRPALVSKNLHVAATFLVDGRVAGTWKLEKAKKSATLRMHPFAPLPPGVKNELTEEGGRLLEFVFPEAATWKVSIG